MTAKLIFEVENKTPTTKNNMIQTLKTYGFETLDSNCVTLNGAMFKILNYQYKDSKTTIELQRVFKSDVYEALNRWYYSRNSD